MEQQDSRISGDEFTPHVTKRVPWSRVLLEGVVIVASILLAFGIDAWWERSQEADLETYYLELLSRDLGEFAVQLEAFLAYDQRTAAAAGRAYDALSGGPSIPNEELSAAISEGARRRTVTMPSAAYQDLINTGNLRLIRNRSLRDEVLRFYDYAEQQMEVLERNTLSMVDGHLAQAVYESGMVRGSFNARLIDFSYRGYREPDDRVWTAPRNSPEIASLRTALHVRSTGFSGIPNRVLERIELLDALLLVELAAR